MPIYEYLCESCGTLTERIQKVTDPGPRTCPECGSRKVARLVSRTSFQLKGGGWYADLYASPKPEGAKKGTHSGKEPGKEAATAPTSSASEPAAAAAKPASTGAAEAPAGKPAAKPAGASKARKGR